MPSSWSSISLAAALCRHVAVVDRAGGGLVEPGEATRICARRECREEAGSTPIGDCPDPALSTVAGMFGTNRDAVLAAASIHDRRRRSTALVEAHEDIRGRRQTFAEIEAMGRCRADRDRPYIDLPLLAHAPPATGAADVGSAPEAGVNAAASVLKCFDSATTWR